jgi:hypothetical protein
MVGIVIWLYKQFMDFLREEREIRRADLKEEREFRQKELDKIATTLVNSDETIASKLMESNTRLEADIREILVSYAEHDRVMKEALIKMDERTKPKTVPVRKSNAKE